ncbi:hypothetical protein KBA73_01180 [Patescibacteria group bacterium]|nr:hypothetical protein [Patescibacteria group bacterium]
MDRRSRAGKEGRPRKETQFAVQFYPSYILIGIEGDPSQPFDAEQNLQSEVQVDGGKPVLITGNMAEQAANYLLTRIQNPTVVIIANETGSSLRVISSNRADFPVGRVLREGDEQALAALLKGSA